MELITAAKSFIVHASGSVGVIKEIGYLLLVAICLFLSAFFSILSFIPPTSFCLKTQ
jgi:hypothetical protein